MRTLAHTPLPSPTPDTSDTCLAAGDPTGGLSSLRTHSTQVEFAVGALKDHPVRPRPAMLANPLDQGAVRLDHPKRVRARIGHFVGSHGGERAG